MQLGFPSRLTTCLRAALIYAHRAQFVQGNTLPERVQPAMGSDWVVLDAVSRSWDSPARPMSELAGQAYRKPLSSTIDMPTI
eukprot:10368710-Alexandrium_andersonii.AAC.1